MQLKTLEDLFIHELKDLYNAENQITKALPKMAKAATSPELKAAFEEHLQETQGQIQRLDQVFEKLGRASSGVVCKAMQGLVAEGEEMVSEEADPEVKDAGLIAAAQRVEHYEMAGYGTVRTFAQQLGHTELADLLQQTLDEEGAADKKLPKLAESRINKAAV